MSFRVKVNVVTMLLLVGVIYAAWPKITEAWMLLDKVNLWVLSLMIPVQIISYYAAGEIMFSYLKTKGHLNHLSSWGMARLALEFNFVNHLLPSGGAAGFSYLTYALHRHGVSTARAAMAQVIRHVLMFLTFIVLLVSSVVLLAVDEKVNRYVLFMTIVLVIGAISVTAGTMYIFKNSHRMKSFSTWIRKTVNGVVIFFTRGKKKEVVKKDDIDNFFEEIHQDYLAILREKRVLYKPFLWSIIANVLDVALLWLAFWALGTPVNPALLYISFGISSIASTVTFTPGGAGVYEAAMIAFLTSAGVSAEVAIAGTLLARVILLSGTVLFGYVFYQLTVNQYGKHTDNS